MGGRGSSSSSRSVPYQSPTFTDGSEKQKAWAGRILKGFDDDMTNLINAQMDIRKRHLAEGADDLAAEDLKVANALRSVQQEYRRGLVSNPTFSSAIRVIDRRNWLAGAVEHIVQRGVEQTGVYGTHQYWRQSFRPSH